MSSSRLQPKDDSGVPRVELRPVGLARSNRPFSVPPGARLIMPPAPPSSPPPSPPSTPTTIKPAPPVIVTTNGTVEKEKGLFDFFLLCELTSFSQDSWAELESIRTQNPWVITASSSFGSHRILTEYVRPR